MLVCQLPCLQSLTCPPSCMSALTSGNPITWLATMYNGIRHSHFPIIKAFKFSIIGTSAPVLVNLKLTESKFSDENACVQMLQDEADTREDSLQSLLYLNQFRIRSWKSLRETKGMKDMQIQQWLIFVPPSLCHVRVITGAHQDQCHLIHWDIDVQRGSWWIAFEQMVSRKDIDGNLNPGRMHEIDDLCQETDDLFNWLEKIHEGYHNDLEATTKSAVHRVDNLKDLGSALREHEV
ncbi:hypothetical protein EDB85DRAFT_1893529 [Lactarius pseudohatsudake]|nr:hypothetical protein EDB85DRAFT_1893529 [Lactarius pseudohatsudake]